MIDIELFVERAVSLAVLLCGVSMRVQDRYWAAAVETLFRTTYGGLVAGLAIAATGVAIVAGHGGWTWSLGVLTTITGWSHVVIGAVLMVFPSAFTRLAGDDEADTRVAMALAGWAGILAGVPMVWRAWFALP